MSSDDEPGAVREGAAAEDDLVVLPITDVLDLHSFPPSEVRDVVTEYLDEAHRHGLDELRIIHGRGIGVQRRSIRALLERHPRVVSFGDAPAEAGGWGATLVRLRSDER
ncbi:MAG: Smr/MutS family protein [Thermoanaerobaculia bacterium]|nr:Smr/MutS family protein [Thermoanaerobaculia bacterium]